MSESLGKRIRRLRLAAGLSQHDLAYQCGYSRSTIIRIEGDESDPSIGGLQAIAEALMVSPGELLVEEGSVPDAAMMLHLLRRVELQLVVGADMLKRQAAAMEGTAREIRQMFTALSRVNSDKDGHHESATGQQPPPS